MEELELKHMGKGESYAVTTDNFDTSLLDKIPRSFSRKVWSITGKEFVGFDVWHCHEATFLLDNGVPIAGTLKIIYPSSTEFVLESKSGKLFLNSFDQCKMGKTRVEAIRNYENQIKKDLSDLLKCKVEVNFFINNFPYAKNDFHLFQPIEELIDIENVEITDYLSKENHLKFLNTSSLEHEYRLTTNVLRSRCEKSKQKDTGTAFIYLRTKQGKELDIVSLFKEIVSLRDVEKFHEPCCEKIFTSILNTGCVDEVCVALLYSRRGSLDINPIRATSLPLTFTNLCDIHSLTFKQQGQ